VSKNGPLLLFDDQTELVNTLTRKDVPTVRVICGDCYQRSKDTMTIRRENSADYTRLVHEVEFARVIHHWAHPTPTLDEALVSGVSSVHLLVQALLRAKKRTPIAFLYPVGIPAFEAVGGYAKTLLQEQPDLRFKTIGIDTGSVDLLLELENAELEVRYLAGRREIRSLEAAPVSNVDQPALRRGGVYLISGGAGGLGRIFARYLIERYDARVVLAGRLNLDEAVLQELRVLGRNAAYVSADISTGEGARKAVDYAKNSYGTINTVVHAAGVLRDGLIWSKTLEDFQAVLGPKVRGAEALDAATVQEPLDSFIVFSSMAGLLGNAGQSDYAYANAYLDAFAHRREELRSKRERFCRTLSINWPLWRGGGMSGTTETGRVAALELQPLEATQGLQLFESALASDRVQVWTGFGDGEKIRVRLLAGQEERRFRQPATGASTEQPRPGTSKTDLIAYLTTVFARVMRLDEWQLKPAESLESYGFDSIMAVEFSQLLEKDFGELSQTLLLEYPTIESLAAHLIERASGRGEHVIERRDQAISTNGTTIARLDETAELCRRLELAPTDYLFVNPRRLAIQVLYYFENRLDFERMKTGLERVAKAFYPINSKLVSDGDRAYVIAESSDIPDFAEIVCDEAVSLHQQDEPVTFEPFRVTFDPLLAGEKLAKFRLIQLERGSLLNVNVSHAIADGYSYYYFLSAWAAASRSEPFQVPDHSRAMLASLANAYREKRGDQFSESESKMDLTPVDPGFDPTTQRIETLHIDPESLLAKTREGADTETRVRLTENGVLAALVWQTYARSLPEDSGELTLACPIDFRRIIPELSPAFFGNASAPALIHLY
jgi:NAD(P)-dependent dehydrogenase (short-subunit alcohol dehydrogenase family)/acyl carrier protein